MGRDSTLALFDVDGTLTPPRKGASDQTKQFLQELQQHVSVGVVGGSDLSKIKEQLGQNVVNEFDYVFAENGLKAFANGDELATESMSTYLGEDNIKRLINYVLRYIADSDVPVKRGTFVEFRNGMINVSPVGRNCSQRERDSFEDFDKRMGMRKQFVEDLQKQFPDLGLNYSIGGQISIDIFPQGWDKTYCLRHVKGKFDKVHFFGDKTHSGGNDFEIFQSDQTIGHSVSDPSDTEKQCRQLFFS